MYHSAFNANTGNEILFSMVSGILVFLTASCFFVRKIVTKADNEFFRAVAILQHALFPKLSYHIKK